MKMGFAWASPSARTQSARGPAMGARQRLLPLLLAACLASHANAQTATAPTLPGGAPAAADEVQPKFLWWGLLLDIAYKYVVQAFSTWASAKLTDDLTSPGKLLALVRNSAQAIIVPIADFMPLGSKSVASMENTGAAEPSAPMQLDNGQENYQGAHVAIVGFDRQGQATGLQPVAAHFRTGERIKLKVLPTFDALLVIENIDPQGRRTQIYPEQSATALSIKRGAEILVPVAGDEFFEFADSTGDEQLVITLRHLRAFGAAESTQAVHRKDEARGSSFVQQTAPGRYPVIAEAIRLTHVR
ncbi:MAG: hypothetical protein ACR2I0_15725 [Rhodoferax sp.]